MKDKQRNPNKWTNEEIEADSQGYIAAQKAYREDREQQERAAAEDADREMYEREFVRQGGSRDAATREWRKHRDAQAARTAEQVEHEAEAASRRNVRSRL
jgi:hypothetical protein